MNSEQWDLRSPFRISGREWLATNSVVVRVADSGFIGRGEGQGVYFLGETIESMIEQVYSVSDAIRDGMTRRELLEALPVGGARNAIDCALWDLEAKQSGRSIWQMVAIDPAPVTTVFTIGIEDSPRQMARHAAAARRFPILKIKLDAEQPVERLEAIRAARPDATIVVDANQGWNFDLLKHVLPYCALLNIDMVEQPLPRGEDEILEGFESPVLLAADESCLDSSELEIANQRYGMINIKLDKTGGLTEALNLAAAARKQGCRLMVGNMTGTSLGMAPSFVVAQLCDFVDIDGPLLLRNDHPNGLDYQDAQVDVFRSGFWG